MFERRRETKPGVEHHLQEEADETKAADLAQHTVDDGANGRRRPLLKLLDRCLPPFQEPDDREHHSHRPEYRRREEASIGAGEQERREKAGLGTAGQRERRLPSSRDSRRRQKRVTALRGFAPMPLNRARRETDEAARRR